MTTSSIIEKIPPAYWRASLAEVNLLHPKVPATSDPVHIDNNDGKWRITSAKPDVATWVRHQFKESSAASAKSNTIPFVLIPARLSSLASHGAKRNVDDLHVGDSILCIPCLLDREGGLHVDPDRHPWIPRDILHPTTDKVAIGTLDDYDHFVSSLPRKASSFDDVLVSASDLFAAVAGAGLPPLPQSSEEDLPEFSYEEHQLVLEWHGIAYEPPIVAAHLIRLYEQILANKLDLPLFDNLRTIAPRPATAPIAISKAQKPYSVTYGHMNPKHPLSPSQREAMVELSQLAPGQVLAVNGPPGTGKTTLLQSVVAQLWVDAALKNGDCPVIAVSSTNVKAVENVLASFLRLAEEIGHVRWHPYPHGFGLFLASESRTSPFPTCTSSTHAFAEHEKEPGVKAAEAHYLDHASRYFQQAQTSVADVVGALHGQLQSLAATIKAIVDVRFQVFQVTRQAIHEGADTSCKALLVRHQMAIEAQQRIIIDTESQLQRCDTEKSTVLHDYEVKRAAILSAEQRWNAHFGDTPFWMILLGFLPFVRKVRERRDRAGLLLSPYTSDLADRHVDFDKHFRDLRKSAFDQREERTNTIDTRIAALSLAKEAAETQLRAAKTALITIEKAHLRWLKTLEGGYEDLADISLEELNDAIDTRIRSRMFAVADWYWSGQWILEMQQRLASGAFDTKGPAKLIAKYRRFAKLSPCLVSNFHMAPNFFSGWTDRTTQYPLWNEIDLLIVDEAGQVSPDIGASLFALAKRALVVGDTCQIEPVWNNGEGTDRSNAVRFGLIDDTDNDHAQYDELKMAGYLAANGNLMRIASRSCVVQKYPDIRGLMLTEHRRCVPQLVAYCNDLIYAGRLDPKRKAIPESERILPALGYLNVSSKDTRAGSTSRKNEAEAKAIVQWLKANQAAIQAHYRDEQGNEIPLWKLVGVISPFAYQAREIQRVLRAEAPALMKRDRELTVGTVHALQGAERAIVIFSPTYGSTFTGKAFFDDKPNMLNVAVSRAKDSFIVIGNMHLFNADNTNKPSGLLAKHLYCQSDADLPVVIGQARLMP